MSERGRDHGQQEQLARTLPRHRPQDPRHDAGPDEVRQREEQRSLAQCEEQGTDHIPACQRRQRDDERDRDQVLDDRPADRHAAVERVELAPVDQRLDDDEGRRDRQARADDQGGARFDAHGNREHRPDSEDDADLDQGAGYRDPRDGAELADRELDAEREQEEDDAEVGELGDCLRIADEARRERPDDDARDEVAEDRRLPEANCDHAEDECCRDGDPQVEDEPKLAGQLEVQLHGRPREQGGLGRLGMRALSRAAHTSECVSPLIHFDDCHSELPHRGDRDASEAAGSHARLSWMCVRRDASGLANGRVSEGW